MISTLKRYSNRIVDQSYDVCVTLSLLKLTSLVVDRSNKRDIIDVVQVSQYRRCTCGSEAYARNVVLIPAKGVGPSPRATRCGVYMWLLFSEVFPTTPDLFPVVKDALFRPFYVRRFPPTSAVNISRMYAESHRSTAGTRPSCIRWNQPAFVDSFISFVNYVRNGRLAHHASHLQ